MKKYILVGCAIMVLAICLIAAISIIGQFRFNSAVKREKEILLAEPKEIPDMDFEDEMSKLPYPVAKWLLSSGFDGQNYVGAVKLKQKGELRTAIGKPWLPMEANQLFVTAQPGFVRDAKIRMAPGIYLNGMDKYSDGKGSMLIKLMSIANVVDAKGPEIDQGTLLRYLAETAWFPTAALSEYIEWRPINEKSAMAKMEYGGIGAEGIFEFNEKGQVVAFSAKRFMENEGEYCLEDWRVVLDGHENMGGFIVPTRVKVIWELEEGDFEWFRCEVTEIEYEG